MTTATDARLEYLRAQIRAESISYGEIAELQGLAEHIDPGDVELLQWAGVPEYPDDDAPESQTQYVVAYGNVADGFSFVGPFNNANDAGDYAGESDDREWWVVKLDPPPAEWLTAA